MLSTTRGGVPAADHAGVILRRRVRYTGAVTFRAFCLALGLLVVAATAPGVRAQTCTPAVQDGTPCEDDLDPCTDDRCDDGVCEHTTVGFVVACRPVDVPFQRVLVLLPFASELSARIAGLPVGDPPAFTAGQRTALVNDLGTFRAQLDVVRRTLAGLEPAAGDTAQSRAAGALDDADAAMTSAVLVRSLVRAAIRANQFSDEIASELDRSSADLLRGTKAVRRDLRRLRKVSQVFQP